MLFTKKTITVLFSITIVLLSIVSTVSGKGSFHPLLENELTTELKSKFKTFERKKQAERVYLMFDKPFYHPGETIWFQGYVRNGDDMKPSKKSEILYVELIAPSGNIEKKQTLIARNGTGSGDIKLDENLTGGLYKIKAYTKWQTNDREPVFFEKEIQIQRVILPALKLKLAFDRETYGKGDKVSAKLTIETLANEPLKQSPFSLTTKIKGKTHIEKTGKTDKNGSANLSFELPKTLDSADGLLSILIPYQGRTESISRSIPILLSNLDLGIFPEGGELVDGFTSKVAVRVIDEFGKPADIEAVVETENGKTITEFKTFHQGLGAFNLTPKQNTNYFIKVLKPAGINKKFAVPEALSHGYTLALFKNKKKGLDIIVNSTQAEELTIVAKSRAKEIKAFSFKARKGANTLSTDTSDFPMGVVQVTLFDSKKIERAERLVFVNKNKKMRVEIQTDKEKYLPREKVKMSIRVFDERDIPLPAQFSLSVADDKLISFADVKQGNILSKLLLEPDLKTTVHEPAFYFDDNEPKADEAMDYLMLTHGWRRFVWKDIFEIDTYSPEHAAEKAEIKGIVLSGRYKGEPVSGAVVKSSLTGKTVKTDKDGTFIFRGIDLYETETLSAAKDGSRTSSIFVSDYNSQVTIYLNNRVVKRHLPVWGGRAKNAMPMVEARQMRLNDIALADEEIQMIQEAGMAPEKVEEAADKVMPVLEEEMPFADEVMIDPRPLKKIAPPPDREKHTPPVYYRAKVFPSPVYSSTTREARVDFRSTIFWKGNIETDRKGKAEVEFYNSDEITAFRSIVEGIGTDGLVGRSEKLFYTQLPFSIDAKIPVEVSMGDTLLLPLTIINNTSSEIEGDINILPPASWETDGTFPATVLVKKGGSKTVFLPFKVLNIPGDDLFRAEFTSHNDTDSVSRKIRVSPKGFPVSITTSSQEKTKKFKVKISRPVTGTISAKLTAFPSVLSDLLKGIESILKEPYGCFEQASSSTYPNIMVMQYLRENDLPDVETLKKARELIEKGYKRLTSFEAKQKGYEWFGADPGHEALTAYGLMEFKDMQGVYDGVDDKMVKRTGNWLLDKRDGKGGFIRNQKALDSFGRADDAITNAYIVYALSEAGFIFEIQKELEAACKTAEESDDPYQLGLVSNALFNIKDKRAKRFLSKLMKHQKEDGSFTGKTHSVTRSTGSGLTVETTALAVLAALKSGDKEAEKINKAVSFIVGARSSYGGFGNTQSTVLALKALVAFTKFSRKTAESGTIEIYINGKKAASKSYDKGEKNEIVIPEERLSHLFAEGEYTIEINYKKVKNPLPYTFAINYSTDMPNASEDCSVGVETTLGTQEQTLKTGETIRLKTIVSNLKPDDGLPMTLVIIGIPGGLSPQPWQLKELQEKRVVDYYEVTGNTVIFYYRQMTPGEKREINLDLKAEIPGKYSGAASCAYLYYTSEFKDWVKGTTVNIAR